MIAKVKTDIFVNVRDEDQAEQACHTISTGLREQMGQFPDGDVILTNVGSWDKPAQSELEELGLTEK